MFVARVVFCMLAALAALAQTEDIFQRLRRALVPSGEGEAASAALARKDFAQVEQLLAAARVSNDAERAELLSLCGAVEFLEGKMGAAVASFRQAAKLAPLQDSDSFTLAMALVKLGHDAEARGVLGELARKYPERAIYVYWLGRLDYDQRRYEEAVEKLSKATDLDPQSFRAWDSLGLAFDMQGRMEQALGAFEKAASLNRNQAHPSPWPPHDLGYLLLRMGKAQEAEAALRESLRYDPELAQAHYHLGRVLEKEGRQAEAIDEYRAAISRDTASPDACYSLAMLYRKLHREAEANAMFAEFRKRKQAAVDEPLIDTSRR